MITSKPTPGACVPRPPVRHLPDGSPGAEAEADTGGPEELLARHRRVLPSWVIPYYDQPLALSHGSGRHVTDTQGRTYLDFFAGILTNSLGYDLPEFRDALQRQLAAGLAHTSTLYLIEAQVRLAERLAELWTSKEQETA